MDVLVTGGAGFIGSNLVRRLVGNGDRVRVIDNFSTGYASNLDGVESVEVQAGDISNLEDVRQAVDGVEVIYHLAALPSVARSLLEPQRVHEVNVGGTLNVLLAARDAAARRVIYASSSSVYGNSPALPKREDMAVNPLSPYAASKLAAEGYCRAFAHIGAVETISLRFFNVFGPRQDPSSEYAAVVPRFIAALLAGGAATIFGDGLQSRDLTYVDNVLDALVLAARARSEASGEVVNVACGDRISVLDLAAELAEILQVDLSLVFSGPRGGDVRHSLASIDKAKKLLGYVPSVDVHHGLMRAASWFAAQGRHQEPEALSVGAEQGN